MSEPLEYHNLSYPTQVKSLQARARELQLPSPRLMRWAFGGMAIGVVAFVVGVFYAPGRTWGALDACFLFWVGLAQGAVVVSATFNTGWARWGRVVQRMIEPLGGFLVFSPLLYLWVWLGRGYIFWWAVGDNHERWLQGGWMLVRDELVLFAMAGLSLWWMFHSMRPDVGVTQGPGDPPDGLRTWLTRGWRGSDVEIPRSQLRLKYLSPFLIAAFVWGYSLLHIDMAMSLDRGFKSTMLPGIYWCSEFLAPLGLGTVLVWAWLRWSPVCAEMVTTSNVRDLGNMAWAFAIFRTWFAWSQYIIIWYGNLPDEAIYIIERWRTHPWNYLAYSGLILVFIGPFFAGFSREIKRNPATCAILGGSIALGVLVDRYVDVLPAVRHLGPPSFGLIELGICLGYAGAIASCYLWLISRVPLFPVSDPVFQKALMTRGTPET